MDTGYRGSRRINWNKLRRFAVLVGCAYLVLTMVRIVLDQEQAKEVQRGQLAQLQAQIDQVRAVNEELERKIEFAGTDAYIERIAREQFGYVKEGEIKFIQDGEQSPVEDPIDDGGEPPEEPIE